MLALVLVDLLPSGPDIGAGLVRLIGLAVIMVATVGLARHVTASGPAP